ncbi:MAG TPA: glycosyltransferase family 1 protein [Patescibacteria group bacterium]|nr:glycosyltransferase family 1 protein [Patescibacteria group bacterium]
MIIGIDGNEANVRERVGINTYAFELLRQLAKLSGEPGNEHSLIVYLKENPLPDMPKEMQNFKYKIIPGGGMWILTKLTPELFFGSPKPDVFFSPSHYVPLVAPMPRVCSIMDLGYLKFSGQFQKKDFWQLKYWTAKSISISKAVIAISNSTKEDIVRQYPKAKNKIHAVMLAYDKEKFNMSISEKDVRRVKSAYSIVTNYVLYLGTLKPSKNIEKLIEAFNLVVVHYPNIKLVIAGKKGWLYEPIFEKAEKLGLKDKVIFTDFIPEADKPALIKGATVFVLPSLWEGFGLDALNAMASGVPVVVGNAGSLPEVVAGAGILIDPNSVESISNGISKVLSMSKSDYNDTIAKGLAQASKFSWEKTARETFKIITNL